MRAQLWPAAAALAAVACAAPGCKQTPPSESRAQPAPAATVEALVPSGWTIEQRHEADFNGDGRRDVLLLLRRPAAGQATPERNLTVALAAASPARYTLHAANSQLVPSDPSGRVEDPMANGEITVRPGGFDLTIGMMAGVGSYQAATLRYRFQFEPGCFRLVEYHRAETHRGTLDTNDITVDFLAGEVVRARGNAKSDASETHRERLANNPRRCLPDLPNGWTFDPLSSS